jgi:D-inositol-3-phosphate glycosyltransferase
MKILFILEYYIPHYGWAEVLFENVIQGLVSEGHSIVVVTTKYQSGLPTHEKVGEHIQIYRVGSNRYNFMRYGLVKSLQLIHTYKFDLIQTTTFNAAVPAGLVRLFHRIPTVLHVHEIYGNLRYRFTWWKWLFYKLFEYTIWLFPFDFYTCSSLYTKNQMRVYFGLSDAKLVTTYCGIDYDLWDAKTVKSDAVEKLKIEYNLNDKVVWLYFGRSGVAKGLSDYLRSLPNIIATIPNFVAFLIVPKTERSHVGIIQSTVSNDEVNGIIESLWVQDHVIWIDSVKYAELKNYCVMADVVVLPTMAEWFGLAVAEVCALGRPLVTTNAGSVPEVVWGKVVLVEPGNPSDIARGVVDILGWNYSTMDAKKFERKDCVKRFLGVYAKLTWK